MTTACGNSVLDAIFTRRSIRHYTPYKVSDDDIRTLLSAAMHAPSAGNEQPWEFVVVTDRTTLDAIPLFHPHARMLKEVSTAIAVCGNMSREKHRGYWVQDCSAATQNILLAAHAIGLSAVWLGINPVPERIEGLSRLLGLPADVIPLAFVPVGYPAEKKEHADRFDESRIHFEKW